MSRRETDNQNRTGLPCRALEDQRPGHPSPTCIYTNTTAENPVKFKQHMPPDCILRPALICYLGEKAKAALPLLLAVAVRRPGKWKEEAALVR